MIFDAAVVIAEILLDLHAMRSKYKKLGYRRDSARCGNGHLRSLKVIRRCAHRRGIHDFLLALNSNLTSIFNRS